MRIRTLDDVMQPLQPESLEQWRRMRQELIENIRFASSVDLLRHDAPLNAQVFDAVEHDGFAVEKVILQTLPGFYLCGNLYRPLDTGKKYPAVLNPHGHWENGRFEVIPLARVPQRCANLALRGMVAFSYDMVGWNDSNQIDHNGYSREFDAWNYSHFSLQLLNGIKALDFVSQLPYVDAEKIGCTGCSGGATQTWFLTAIDERVKACAPINMVSTIMQGGCTCESAPFLRTRFCNVDYARCVAPRPMFLSGSDGDWTIHSREVEFPAVRRVYALYGAEDRLETFYQSAPHCYNLPIRERVYDFFCRAFGLQNPFPGEVDMEFTREELSIGDLRARVPAEGYVEGDEQLFALVKDIIRKNLARLGKEEKARLIRNAFLNAFPPLQTGELDIPFILDERTAPPVLRFGACPPGDDWMGIKHPSCYNQSRDEKRLILLAELLKQHPDAQITAEGKSAKLLEAARCVNAGKGTFDAEGLEIPGIELVKGALG